MKLEKKKSSSSGDSDLWGEQFRRALADQGWTMECYLDFCHKHSSHRDFRPPEAKPAPMERNRVIGMIQRLAESLTFSAPRRRAVDARDVQVVANTPEDLARQYADAPVGLSAEALELLVRLRG